jgi:hypothetical protein
MGICPFMLVVRILHVHPSVPVQPARFFFSFSSRNFDLLVSWCDYRAASESYFLLSTALGFKEEHLLLD